MLKGIIEYVRTILHPNKHGKPVISKVALAEYMRVEGISFAEIFPDNQNRKQ